jgi:hypothetical protein
MSFELRRPSPAFSLRLRIAEPRVWDLIAILATWM